MCVCDVAHVDRENENVLFIVTQFSNLSTAVDTNSSDIGNGRAAFARARGCIVQDGVREWTHGGCRQGQPPVASDGLVGV